MLFALVVVAIVASQNAGPKQLQVQLTDPLTGEDNATIIQRTERLDPAQKSPKKFDGKQWEFDWMTAGYAQADPKQQQNLRFRVFSQERKGDKDVALSVAMMDLRMWELVHHKYKIDNADMGQGLRLVDEYLCWGGKAGGEQLLGEGTENNITRRVNTIYIYDIASFKDPMEMAREVAHEYGHAVLPAIGGFKTPEDWANGYLGEKLFLRWLRDACEMGRLDTTAVMNVPYEKLDAWVKKNVDPLVLDTSSHAPNKTLLSSSGQKAMNSFMGLVLYADSILPNNVVARSFKLMESDSAKDYPQALVDAASEGSFTVSIPNMLYGSKIWIPLGKSTLKGGKILSRAGAWAQVQPSNGPLIVLAPGS